MQTGKQQKDREGLADGPLGLFRKTPRHEEQDERERRSENEREIEKKEMRAVDRRTGIDEIRHFGAAMERKPLLHRSRAVAEEERFRIGNRTCRNVSHDGEARADGHPFLLELPRKSEENEDRGHSRGESPGETEIPVRKISEKYGDAAPTETCHANDEKREDEAFSHGTLGKGRERYGQTQCGKERERIGISERSVRPVSLPRKRERLEKRIGTEELDERKRKVRDNESDDERRCGSLAVGHGKRRERKRREREGKERQNRIRPSSDDVGKRKTGVRMRRKPKKESERERCENRCGNSGQPERTPTQEERQRGEDRRSRHDVGQPGAFENGDGTGMSEKYQKRRRSEDRRRKKDHWEREKERDGGSSQRPFHSLIRYTLPRPRQGPRPNRR